jgi:hypothetical protein
MAVLMLRKTNRSMNFSLIHTMMSEKNKNIGLLVVLLLLSNWFIAQQALMSSGGGSPDGMLSYSLGLLPFIPIQVGIALLRRHTAPVRTI